MQTYLANCDTKVEIFTRKEYFCGEFLAMLSSILIKKQAAQTGFNLCGITRCRQMDDNEAHFRAWLSKGHHAQLSFLERNLDKRFDTRRLLIGAQTIVVCAVSYKNHFSTGYPADFSAKIASYALCRDYHQTLKEMLWTIFQSLKATSPTLSGRAFVDSAPLLEKQIAVDAGLGWIGRQSLLITPHYGSFVLLGELLLTEECDSYDTPFEGSRCNHCHNCVTSCPVQALSGDRTLDATRCISCHTIENAGTERQTLDGWLFGCERCQNSCPYNQTALPHTHPAFDPIFNPLDFDRTAWLSMTEEAFSPLFGTTPLMRSGLSQLKQNLLP